MEAAHFEYLVKKGLATPEIIKAFVKEHKLEHLTEAELINHIKTQVKTAGTKINKSHLRG